MDHGAQNLRILAKLQHPFIVNMFGSFHDPRYIYMVLEYIVGGEFFTHLRKVTGKPWMGDVMGSMENH